MLHGFDDITSLPEFSISVLVFTILPRFNLGNSFIVSLLTENDLSTDYTYKLQLPEIAADQIVLHTTPIGAFIIQTLFYPITLAPEHLPREKGGYSFMVTALERQMWKQWGIGECSRGRTISWKNRCIVLDYLIELSTVQ